MNPRSATVYDYALDVVGSSTPSNLESCATYTHLSGTFVITLLLDQVYLVDAILLKGDDYSYAQVGEYLAGPIELYVGNSPDYTQNTRCENGPVSPPYLIYDGTINFAWENGVEAWCGIAGNYVSVVRDPAAITEQQNVSICTLGIISNTEELPEEEEESPPPVVEEEEFVFFDAELEPFEVAVGDDYEWTLPINAANIDLIEVVSVNAGEAAAFTEFDEESFTFTIDGDLLTEDFVGSQMITITLQNDSEEQISEIQGFIIVSSAPIVSEEPAEELEPEDDEAAEEPEPVDDEEPAESADE